MNSRPLTLIAALVLSLGASAAFAASIAPMWKWARQYRIGVDSSSSRDTMTVGYQTSVDGHTKTDRCTVLRASNDPTADRQMECTVDLVAGESQGYGLFFQRAFRRQGLFYLNYDIGMGVRALQGQLPQEQVESGLPMKRLRFFLYGANLKPYIQFGITPAHVFPDLLFQIGPALQLLVGNVEINNDQSYVAMANGGLIGGDR